MRRVWHVVTAQLAKLNKTKNSLFVALGYTFQNPSILKEALTHRSFGTPHNERLEFLGDGVLNFVVAHLLYQKFPSLNEGQLSRIRANLVKESTLSEIAKTIHLRDSLYLGDGEKKKNTPDSILADAMEAIFGAVFLDSGFDNVQQVIAALYNKKIADIDLNQSQKDPKSRLQEFVQGKKKTLPQYCLIKESGADHNKTFWVQCAVGKITAQASGHSLREAEQKAAEICLSQLQQC